MKSFFIGPLILLITSCAFEAKPVNDVPDAKMFWVNYIQSLKSGEGSKLLSCFSEPHSDLVLLYVESEAIQVKFVKELFRKFGESGIDHFNNHNIVGGRVLTWPPILADIKPDVVARKRNTYLLDINGWRLKIQKSDDGKYQIINAIEALDGHGVRQLQRIIDAYVHGYERLLADGVEIEDIPLIRDEMFELLLGVPRESFRRY